MKAFMILLCFLGTADDAFCQQKEVSVERIVKRKDTEMACRDSNGSLTKTCPLYLSRFEVRPYNLYFDKRLDEYRVIGRVCVGESINNSGVADVEIFIGTIQNGVIINRRDVGVTTFGKEYISNDGFFDISFKLLEEESLFFERPVFYLEAFTINKPVDK